MHCFPQPNLRKFPRSLCDRCAEDSEVTKKRSSGTLDTDMGGTSATAAASSTADSMRNNNEADVSAHEDPARLPEDSGSDEPPVPGESVTNIEFPVLALLFCIFGLSLGSATVLQFLGHEGVWKSVIRLSHSGDTVRACRQWTSS